MPEEKTRGYVVAMQAKFAKERFDVETNDRIARGMPEPIRNLSELRHAEWYPREYSVQMLRAIAGVKNDPNGSFEDLVECGRFVSDEASNTYMKILMRILTPKMWASKLHKYWQRDHTSGGVEVETDGVAEHRLGVRLHGIGGFDHIGAVSVGFLERALEGLGKKGVRVAQSGWTFDNPAPDEVRYSIQWDA